MTYRLEVQTSAGDGLLARKQGAVLFIPSPVEDGGGDQLLAAFKSAAAGDEFVALAEATIQSELQTLPFIAIQVEAEITLRVFGDAELRTDIPSVPLLSAGASSTWVDHRVHGNPDAALLSAGAEAFDARTDLDLGVVNAGGFAARLTLSSPVFTLEAPVDQQPSESPAVEVTSDTAERSELLDYVLGAFPKSQATEAAPSLAGELVFDDGERHVLAGDLVLGRNPTQKAEATKAAPLLVAGDRVSRAHLRLRVTGDQVWAEDCDSRNGSVLVNSPDEEPFKLLANSPQEIADGAVLYLGSRSFTFSKNNVGATSTDVKPKRKDPIHG